MKPVFLLFVCFYVGSVVVVQENLAVPYVDAARHVQESWMVKRRDNEGFLMP